MKHKTFFICQNCGFHSPKWLGKCPNCGEWNTLIEEVEEEVTAEFAFPPSEPLLYKDIKEAKKERIQTDIEELNRVLGGGVVLGSLVLIGGEPGIGKSTLLLQVSRDFAAQGEKVLYVSGEESLDQIRIRGQRLGLDDGHLYLLAETGIFCLVTMLFLWFITFKRLIFCLKKDDSFLWKLAAGMLCGLTALFIHSQVEEGFHIHQALNTMLWAYFGIAAALKAIIVRHGRAMEGR